MKLDPVAREQCLCVILHFFGILHARHRKVDLSERCGHWRLAPCRDRYWPNTAIQRIAQSIIEAYHGIGFGLLVLERFIKTCAIDARIKVPHG